MQLRDNCPQQWGIFGMYRARDFLDKFLPNFAIFVAHREAVEHRRVGGMGSVDIFGHATPRRFDRIAELV